MTRRLLRTLTAVAVLTVPVCAGLAGPASAAPPGKPVTVMTRNLYLGADINRPVVAAATAAAQGQTGLGVVTALANATQQTRAIVDRTDFRTRAALLADEIVSAKPDFVGLQEVALWRSGPLELTAVGTTNATHVDLDFLAVLQQELQTRVSVYDVAVVGTRADVESPSFTGSPADGTMGGAPRDVRLTMRDAILVRRSGSITVGATQDRLYDANLATSVSGVAFRFDRGYQWVDATVGATRLRFVNTHLESASSALAAAQAGQVVKDATAANRSTVMVCDCNSNPLDSTVAPGDQAPNNAAYRTITGTYADQWQRWSPNSDGFTYGTGELANDTTTAGFTQRIDMVFGRRADGTPLDADRGTLVGNAVTDRDPATGLWPSDHAGLVLRLRGL